MSYNNINIICVSEGIPIVIYPSSKNTENIFAYDSNKALLPNFTFPSGIIPDLDILSKAVQDAESCGIQYINNGYLFYSFSYQKSFAHYLTQTVPLLADWFQNYRTHKLLVPEFSNNNLQKDLLKVLNIADDDIIILKNNTSYNIKSLIKLPPYDAPPEQPSNNHKWIYNKIREHLNIIPNTKPFRNIYLKRDGVANTSFGNSETGITRLILNNEHLEMLLMSYNFEIITLGDKMLEEKKELLKDANIIISQLGANCMNFIFTNAPNSVLLLSNTEPLGADYYIPLCAELNNSTIDYTVFYSTTIDNSRDQLNGMNGPFMVNLNEINEWINKRLN